MKKIAATGITYVPISCTDVYCTKDSKLVCRSEETEEHVSWGLERSGPELNMWRVQIQLEM
jgi:hypothetical protein